MNNYLAIGNDEIAQMPPLGKTIKCWICGKRHKVQYGKKKVGDAWVESKTLAFFKCGGELYLCGLNRKEWRP